MCFRASSRYARSPGHVVIEAVCIIFIIYLIMRKPYNPKKTEKLSKQVCARRPAFSARSGLGICI